MSLNNPRLRGGASRRTGPYQLGDLPDEVLHSIGRQIVHRIATGHNDISGDDFGTIFAKSIGGEHRASPLGIGDVILNGCAWSVKTVQANNPDKQKVVRLISGRNSPDYSAGIENPHADPTKTGHAVLSIWNARVDEALNQFDDLRVVVMMRNMQTRNFRIFEEEAYRYNPRDFEWKFNKNNNLEGRNRITGKHQFTWQSHGSQFTVLRSVPASARGFSINRNIRMVDPDTILAAIKFRPTWITIHG